VLDVRLHPVRPDTGAGQGADPGQALPQQLHLHIGAAAVPVRVRPLGSDPAGDTTARLTLSSPLPLRIGDRALLRDPGRQRIAAGLTVLDVRPPPLTRRGSAARRALQLADMTAAGDPAAEVTRRGLVRRDELAAMGVELGRLTERSALSAGEWLLDRARATELSARLVAAVAEHDAADPLDPGLPLGAARRVLELPDAKLVDALLRQPPSAGQLVARDGRVHRAGPGDALPAEVRRAMDAVRVELTASPFAAPDAGRLAELGLGPRELAGLVRAGELVKVADGVYLLPGAERAAVEVLATLDEPEFTLSAARQALGTSRRVAVPLLERLARLGLTRRTQDGRHRVARG